MRAALNFQYISFHSQYLRVPVYFVCVIVDGMVRVDNTWNKTISRNESKLSGDNVKSINNIVENENFQIRQSIGLSIKFPLRHTHWHWHTEAWYISAKWVW